MSVITDDQILDQIKQIVGENKVALFMKGTPEAPRCGFSARVVGGLEQAGAEYAALDVLVDPRIRQVLSGWSNWPTIPQLFVDGQLVGGCDIVEELAEAGELPGVLQGAPDTSRSSAPAPVTGDHGFQRGDDGRAHPAMHVHKRADRADYGMQEVWRASKPGQTGRSLLAKPE